MSNDYFNYTTPVGALTRALSDQISTLGAGVAAGFDKLPDPNAWNGGLLNFGVSTGALGNYQITLSPPLTSTPEGVKVTFRATTPIPARRT